MLQKTDKWGAHYFNVESPTTYRGLGLYPYTVWIGGRNDAPVELGPYQSVIRFGLKAAEWWHDRADIFAPLPNEVTIRLPGYLPPFRHATYPSAGHLPYVNGCSTAQIFPPLRKGDPTLQWLRIPPHSSEQAHHIHSTARVVLVIDGAGDSVVGMGDGTIRTALTPGTVVVLEPMCPHHFETGREPLVCVPFHVWSSAAAEFAHPMFQGTHLMNQGE